MTMFIARAIGLVITLAVVLGGAVMIYDFQTNFIRNERLMARREARRTKRELARRAS